MITATNMPKAIIKDNASNTDTMITTLRGDTSRRWLSKGIISWHRRRP